MMKRPIVKILICALLATLVPTITWAQNDEELDYLKYKYFQEEEEMLWWLSMEFEGNDIATESAELRYAPKSLYALRSVKYQRWGEQHKDHRYKLNGLSVDYSTARLLNILKVGRHELPNITTYHIKEGQPRYSGFKIDGGVTGRNYTASLQLSSRHQLSPHDVPLATDWVIGSALRITAGPDLYIDGVASNGCEAALSAYRTQLNNTLFFALTLPYTKRNLRQYSTSEAYRLTGNTLYNPAWGMYNGKMRNSRQHTRFTPEALGVWEHKISAWTTMTLSSRLQFEHGARTSLGWYDADTPMPDNYRYMPSYFSDDSNKQLATEAWTYNDLRYTQIDWDGLYLTNTLQSDGHAAYALESRVNNALRFDCSLMFRSQLRGVDLSYGVALDIDTEHRFKRAGDLLGADYLYNIDYFIADDATHGTMYRNNLRNTTLEVYEGDKFGYDYRLSALRTELFANALFGIADWDFKLRANLSNESFRRRGYFEKELFSGHGSWGRSPRRTLYPASLALRGKYSAGYHRLNIELEALSKSPNIEAQYLQPDYNNRLVDNLRTSISLHAHAEYQLTLQRFELSATLYATHHSRQCDVVRYYDDRSEEYSDAVISGLTHTNFGIEVDATARWTRYLSSMFTLAAGRYRYTDDAQVRTYADKNNILLASSTSHMRGLATGCPEIAAYGDLMYYRDGWRATLSAQYWGMRYVTPSPIRRTERILEYAHSPEERNMLQTQQRLDDAAMLCAELSKNFRLKGDVQLRVSLSVENILGSKIIYAGYEQHRTRYVRNGYYTSIAPFDNKLSYAYGRTFRLSLRLTL